ncbi:protein quick-to-court isoform X2 [Aethina tumida]|uniref:protein quick-to-court isoform X2 n=1 Tax=Aethina tumida TaxID=116153 RepID=UPI00214894C3|nr:protein quick-to-court isoform X2 [Aethina tumida]
MSADMFTTKPVNPLKSPEPSRIPLPSPTPLRRYGSLRLRGENKNGLTSAGDFTRNIESLRTGGVRPQQEGGQCAVGVPLQRGHSFMEKGEKKYGSRGQMASRPQTIRTTVKVDRNGGIPTPKQLTTPQSPNRIRSLSLSLSNTRLNSPKSPSAVSASSPKSPADQVRNHLHASNQLLDYRSIDWDDTDSIISVGGSSVASCDHASVARNGTTFSGRSMKYVFHCNQHAGATGEDYLTPTQRAHRQVKKLKYLLQQAKKDLEQKDSDILKLTKEVVELRLYKAALSSPEDKSNSSDAVTVRENTSEETSPEKDVLDAESCVLEPNHLATGHSEMNNSFADSGHFEDCTNSSVHSKDSILFDDGNRSPFKTKLVETSDKGITANFDSFDHDSEHSKLIMEYEKRLQELVRTHEEESYHLKQKHNDKVEELLQRITEINARYWELVPELDTARDRIKELEVQLEEASKKLQEQEDKQKQSYLQMYNKGQEAARLEHENRLMELAHQNPSRISVPELLQELQVTKNELENIKAMYRQLMEAKSRNKIDPEITLQFLKSAVYYFLTDRENSQGHLKAIQSILGFTTTEIDNISKARLQ